MRGKLFMGEVIKKPIEISYTNPHGNTYFGEVLGDENALPYHYNVRIKRMDIRNCFPDLFLRRVIMDDYDTIIAKNVCEVKKEEIWKDVEGFVGKYQVSNLGRVKSFQIKKEGIILNPSISQYGYLNVTFNNKDERQHNFIHRLVATAFIPNPENKKTVNHKDGNKKNNSIENLEWATSKEQMVHCLKNNLRLNFGWGNKKGIIKVFDKFGNLIDELNGDADMRNKGYNPKNVSRYIRGRKHPDGLIFKRITETLLDRRKEVVYGIFQGLKHRENFEKNGFSVKNIQRVKKLLKENNILSLEDYEKYLNRDKEGV